MTRRGRAAARLPALLLLLIAALPGAGAQDAFQCENSIPATISGSLDCHGVRDETYSWGFGSANLRLNLTSNFADPDAVVSWGSDGRIDPLAAITGATAYSIEYRWNGTSSLEARFQYSLQSSLIFFHYFDLRVDVLKDGQPLCSVPSVDTASGYSGVGFSNPAFHGPYRASSIWPHPKLLVAWGFYSVYNATSKKNEMLAPGDLLQYRLSDGMGSSAAMTCMAPAQADQTRGAAVNMSALTAPPQLSMGGGAGAPNDQHVGWDFLNLSSVSTYIVGTSCSNGGPSDNKCEQSAGVTCDGFIPIFGASAAGASGISLQGFAQWIGGLGFCVGTNLIKPILSFVLTLVGFAKATLLTLFPEVAVLLDVLTFPVTATVTVFTGLLTLYLGSGSKYGPGGVWWSLLMYSLDLGLATSALSRDPRWAWRAPLAFLKGSTVGVAVVLYWAYWKIPLTAYDKIHEAIIDYRG